MRSSLQSCWGQSMAKLIDYLAHVFQETDVKPEIEVFETGMMNNALFVQKRDLIHQQLHFDFVLY